MRTRLALAFASFFGCGYVPVAPGTVGTAAGLPLAWLMSHAAWPWQLVIVGVVTGLAMLAAAEAGRALGIVDARQIVVDEVAGILVTMVAVPFNFATAVAAFALFRVFDILKPWPASYFDRKVKNGAGVVLDDIMAGLYARAAIALLLWAFPTLFGAG